MNRGIYSSAVGMVAAQRQLDVLANNLANASTNGYKRDELAFNDIFAKQMSAGGLGGAGFGSMGYGPTAFTESTVFGDLGEIRSSGNPLDCAIATPEGAFAVRTPEGQVRYTRDGAFTRLDGKLATSRGDLVLDDRLNEIELGEGKAQIQPDGSVLVEGKTVGSIGVFEGQFRKLGGSLYEGNGVPVDSVSLKPNAIEGSNVNVIRSMVEMIELNRTFEMAQKSITSQDELAQRLIQSLQDR